jgi:hypothetical protein
MTEIRHAWPVILIPLLAVCSSPTDDGLVAWEADLAPVAPSSVNGSAAAVTQFGRTQASIQIRQAEPDVTYGWRIETGTCQAPGDVQGGAAAYAPLVASEAGQATADAGISIEFRSGSSFAVRVFLPLEGGGETIVACGALVEDT